MQNRMIRFITCGHVDDGKSTLIGRLLYEMGVIPEDQIAGATTNGVIDYSRLTDGLEDERAQGITIDVAYRYFHKDDRYYRIADTPGHVQYLRNMAVAAVDSDAVFLLVDALHGVRDQTIRHARIAAFFGVKHFVIAVNKMDLVEYAKGRYDEISEHFRKEMCDWKDINITFIPVSAINGDNVTIRSSHMLWYQGPTVKEYLENFTPPALPKSAVRFPVQYVIRITDTVRGYQGTLSGDSIKIGDKLRVAATGDEVTITKLYHSGCEVGFAHPGQAITLVIAEDVDLSHGSLLCDPQKPAILSDNFHSEIFWLSMQEADKEAFQGILKIHHSAEMAEISVESFNGPIGKAETLTASPITFDPFAQNPRTGLFLLIEPETEKVVGIGKAIKDAKEAIEAFAI